MHVSIPPDVEDLGLSDRGDRLGVVVIGRNEGKRLRRCLSSVLRHPSLVAYVDSASTDGSADAARSMGVQVVELDMSLRFTAARARNAGFRALEGADGDPAWIQFLDGDCEVMPGWLKAGIEYLQDHPDVAAVSGRLRERFPDASLYNRMCDDEWNTPVGEARHCGGNVMVRAAAFAAVGGFRESLLAGEEPELCVRLRAAGWRIWRIDAEMALHDAAMTRFGQWWRRAVRSGYAYAAGASLHGRPPERHWVRESRRAWIWAAGIPLAAVLGVLVGGPGSLILLALYPLQVVRRTLQRPSGTMRERLAASAFETLARFAELRGQWSYWRERLWQGQCARYEYRK